MNTGGFMKAIAGGVLGLMLADFAVTQFATDKDGKISKDADMYRYAGAIVSVFVANKFV